MSNIWFTSDTHYAHANICGPNISKWDRGYRDFGSIWEMNDAICDSINSRVLPDDTLYHLGDWSFGGKDKIEQFRNRIACRNIILIYGNHDHHIKKQFRHLFIETHNFLERYINNQFIVMSHYAMRVWQASHRGTWCLYGHSHGSLPDAGGKTFDIGWCVWRRPLSFDEVKAEMDKRSINFIDHHGENTDP